MSARRSGFILLTALWMMAGIATLATLVLVISRDGIYASRNRVDLTRAEWLARGCVERTRAAIGEALADTSATRTLVLQWTRLDRLVSASTAAGVGRCVVELRAAGSALDVNDATDDQIRACLAAAGRSDADALTDALLDWRDSDDVSRPLGAESQWYFSRRRPGPRNGPLQERRELRLIRGFESASLLDTLLGTEADPVAVNNAAIPVLLTVPGMSLEAAQRLIDARQRGAMVEDLLQFSSTLSEAARDSMISQFAALSAATTIEPAAWILTATDSSGHPAAYSTIEVRFVRTGDRAAIVRWRNW